MRLRLKDMIRALRSEAFFAGTMMAASMLSFVKAMALAWLLTPSALGFYLTGISYGFALSMIMTFGEVERTYTLYPSYVARAGTASIFGDAISVAKQLVKRFAVLTVSGVLLAPLLGLEWLTRMTVLTIGVMGLAILLLSLLASVARAIDASKLLPNLNFLRGSTALVAALAAYSAGANWVGILAIEGTALLVLSATISWYLKMRYGTVGAADLARPQERSASRGRRIWVAAMITAAIPYGGRAAVLALSGAATAGAFGLLMLIVQAGQMVAAALSQKLAPALVRQEINTGEARSLWETFAPINTILAV